MRACIRVSLLCLAGLASLAAVACHGSEATEADTIVVALDATPQTLDPRFAGGANAVHVIQLICNALYKFDRSGTPVPDLARAGHFEGPRRFRVELREDVRFHDGTPLRARDVEASFASVLDPGVHAIAAGGLAFLERVRADGEFEVVFELREPFAPLLYKLADVMILPAGQVAAAGKKALESPICAGPFKLAAFDRGGRILLERHAEYFGGAPPVSRVLLRVLPNSATRVLELLKGSVHLVVNGVPPYALRPLEEAEGLRVLRGPGASTTYLGLNLEHPELADPRVRRALAHAIDRAAIVDTLLRGRASLASALLPPGHAARPAFGEGIAYDPARARELLDAAGYPDPAGPEPRFRISYKTSTDRLRKQIGEVIGYQLGEVGIEMETRSLEWGTFYGDIQRGNFHAYTLKWVGLTDPDIFHYVFHSASIPPEGANRGRYRSDRVDHWIERSRGTADETERRGLYRSIEKTLARDLPYVFLWHEDDTAVVSKRLDGFELEPGGGLRALARVRLHGAGS